jgi:hypothetical protein
MKNNTLFVSLSWAILAFLTLAQSSLADDSHDGGPDHPEHEHHNRWAVSFSPRYYGLNSNGYSSAFTSAGVSAPSSGTVGGDFSVYWTLDSDWQIGLGFGGVSTSNSSGTSQASYSSGFFGLWLAKDFQLNDDIDLAVGSLFASGSAQAQVITTGVSGQTNESSFTLEPKVIVTHKIAHWLKIGVSGSYIEPVGMNQTIQGNTLTTGHISLHGISGGVEFVFGRFGHPST